ADHPFYVLKSIFFYEPLAIIQELFTGQFVPPASAIAIVLIATSLCALLLFGSLDAAGSCVLVWAAMMFFAMSLLPALALVVMPLLLVDPAFLLYAVLSLMGLFFLARLVIMAVIAIYFLVATRDQPLSVTELNR